MSHALERGIEAEFELEDDELTSSCPREQQPGPHAFTGQPRAGVLRQLQADQGWRKLCAPPRRSAALTVLTRVGAAPRLLRNLLTYGNQRHHELINRHAIRDLLLRHSPPPCPLGRE